MGRSVQSTDAMIPQAPPSSGRVVVPVRPQTTLEPRRRRRNPKDHQEAIENVARVLAVVGPMPFAAYLSYDVFHPPPFQISTL